MAMRDYEELVKALRDEDNCNVLDYIDEAADAIEELVSNADKFKWIKIESRPMTEEERKEWSERIGYDIEYQDASIYIRTTGRFSRSSCLQQVGPCLDRYVFR